MKKYVLYLILFFQAISLNAYIYNAVVMRKWHEDFNRFHYFIGLGDFHHKQHPANKEHLNELQALLAEVNKDSLKVFTEDLSVSNDIGRRSARGFSVNSRGGLLGGLTDVCRDMGIDAQNIEYRYARVCALGPVLNNAKLDPFSFDSTRKLFVGDLVEEIYSEIDRIAHFRDGPSLQAWYQQCTRDIEAKMASFDWRVNQKRSVAEYLEGIRKPLSPVIQNLLTFDASLLDVKIVHGIVQHANVERICAIAGGSHIDRAGKALKKIGYTPVWHMISEGSNPGAIDVGSEAYKSEYTIKPAPISLQVLKKFF